MAGHVQKRGKLLSGKANLIFSYHQRVLKERLPVQEVHQSQCFAPTFFQCFQAYIFPALPAMQLTGWWLGYLIAPTSYIRPLQKLQQNFFICANSFVQHAGVAALQGPQEHVAEMVQTYDKRRKFILKRICEIGFGVKSEPNGAYYVLADAREFGDESLKLSRMILEEAGVAVTPGIDFGDGAEGYLRFSYANSLENISEGIGRIENYLNGSGNK